MGPDYWQEDGDVITSRDDRWEVTYTGSAGDSCPYTLRENRGGEWWPVADFQAADVAKSYAERH